ncbi:myosin light chain kinase family member 4 [Eurytemora carolleeae]|uniref:myosin light chain kinase family member 4 n=1 Tax=Eurytemora carolleeae TaxID=1294199 RepID=UPI000C785DA0|nr:myosin light chain kinase family member 4 [Eurytemora carolleeae]|eukprot:XP_023348884.1 myosin light chain kinase family member 4-like [Eurytemora affinis]
MVGTLEFMSPEVMKCSHASPASDMWSCGVLLYMLLSGGVSPFWAGNDYGTQRKVVKGQYRLDIPQFDSITEEYKIL